jgi:hypothetical protein
MENLVEMILAGLAAYLIISLIWYIIMVIANWRIFTKAGEAGWKSIIPFLNTYVLFKIAWNIKMFWIMLGTLIAGSICTSIAGEQGGVLAIIGAVFSLASCVIGIISVHKLSKSFGYGIGFTLGLLFLSPIFTLILGLGSSEYIGPQ